MKQNTLRIATGLIITTIGIGSLLGALNVFPFWDIFKEWWAVLLIIAGIFTLIGDYKQNYIWGGVLITVGALITLKNIELVDFNVFGLIAPIIIISAGLSVIINTRKRPNVKTDSKNSDDISAVFSGNTTINSSQKYQGGNISAIFGGAEIDLRDAKLADGAQIDLLVFCGGVEIKVPRDWRIVSKITAIAGGVENKTRTDDKSSAPTLILTGTVALGGVEIKS